MIKFLQDWFYTNGAISTGEKRPSHRVGQARLDRIAEMIARREDNAFQRGVEYAKKQK